MCGSVEDSSSGWLFEKNVKSRRYLDNRARGTSRWFRSDAANSMYTPINLEVKNHPEIFPQGFRVSLKVSLKIFCVCLRYFCWYFFSNYYRRFLRSPTFSRAYNFRDTYLAIIFEDSWIPTGFSWSFCRISFQNSIWRISRYCLQSLRRIFPEFLLRFTKRIVKFLSGFIPGPLQGFLLRHFSDVVAKFLSKILLNELWYSAFSLSLDYRTSFFFGISTERSTGIFFLKVLAGDFPGSFLPEI